MKKIILTISIALLLFCSFSCESAAAKKTDPEQNTPAQDLPLIRFKTDEAVKDDGSKAFSDISVIDSVKNMTLGWNLGNTFDATGGAGLASETSWGQPKTTKAMIDGLASSGIKTIRIPISWARHMDKTTYTINKQWMLRVKEVVDWAIEDGMYVIINAHHDNGSSPKNLPACGGYYPNSTNFDESERFLANVWTQIGLAFNDGYDEHLVFETMNEPRLAGTSHEWWFDVNAAECKDAADALNRLNQVAVDAIRSTGGNNKKRFIMIPGLQASPDSALANAFKMPVDDEPGKLILSVHMYSPYVFAMQSPGAKTYTSAMKSELKGSFGKLNSQFVSKGYPVIVGEYGATNKDNLEDRVAWFTDFLTISRSYGMTCCLWDNGVWKLNGNDYNEHYGYYNRTEQTWYFPEILDAMVNSTAE